MKVYLIAATAVADSVARSLVADVLRGDLTIAGLGARAVEASNPELALRTLHQLGHDGFSEAWIVLRSVRIALAERAWVASLTGAMASW